MLVLSQKIGQSIQIGADVTVMFAGFNRHGQVKLGITAPKDVAIYRSELLPHEPPAKEETP